MGLAVGQGHFKSRQHAEMQQVPLPSVTGSKAQAGEAALDTKEELQN